MGNITKKYETKLETAKSENISAILDAKLEATSPERVTDYVAFGIENLEATIARINGAEAELKAIKAETQSQIDLIKTGTAQWMAESGVDSLQGDITSSMKATQPKAKEVLKITTNEDELINQGFFKTTLDKIAIKNAILDGQDIDGAEIEVTHQEPSLTLYKKRK